MTADQIEELNNHFAILKEKGKRIIDCIAFVLETYHLPLNEAQDLVLNTPVWANEKQAFIAHNEEMQREFLMYAANEPKTK